MLRALRAVRCAAGPGRNNAEAAPSTHTHTRHTLARQIVERDVPARYLLRLGMGEAELDTDLDFSRVGRVNAMLARRLELLAEVRPGGARRRCVCVCVWL